MAIALNKFDGSNVAVNTASIIAWAGGAPAIGDLIVIGAAAASDGVTFGWPAGYVRLGAYEPVDGVGSMEVRYKISTGGDVPTTITHPSVLSGANGASYSGVRGVSPSAALTRETVASLTHDSGLFVVPDSLERLLISFGALTALGTPLVPPPGFTQANGALGVALSIAQDFRIVSAPGSYGGNWTNTNPGDWATIGFALLNGGQGFIGGSPGGGFL